MLQIATGMYFRDVPLNETCHRAALYTNASVLQRDPLDLPVGRFLFATTLSPVTTVTIEVIDRLESVRPDGQDEFLFATSGTELIDDAADVFSFALNVSCSRNAALMERSVPPRLDGRPTRGPSSILRRTFDPEILLRDEEIDDARQFVTSLLRLRRTHFEVAMRAIRRVVDATLLVSDDPTLAYTLFVAALEALAQISIAPEDVRSWDTYDGRKRNIIDAAIADLAPEEAARVREAVLEIDQLSLARRFRTFTLAHVEPSFYRAEAVAAVRPMRASDLANALNVAYSLRSRNVHLLEVLAPELWAISDRADALSWKGRSVLSLEGLNRLCRHVIRVFVERSPTDLDTEFDYREHLPGIVKMEMAPQYWIWNADGFTVARAPRVLEGFVELLVEVLGHRSETMLADLTAVLEKIEAALPATADSEARQPLVAIYILWHSLMSSDHHRPECQEVIEQYHSDLDEPTVVGFVVRLLISQETQWSVEDLVELVERRRDELRRGRGQPLPARVDAALLLATALRLWDMGRPADAMPLISEAVETLPGNEHLVALEEAAQQGERPADDLLDFVVARGRWGPVTDQESNPETVEADGQTSESDPDEVPATPIADQ